MNKAVGASSMLRSVGQFDGIVLISVPGAIGKEEGELEGEIEGVVEGTPLFTTECSVGLLDGPSVGADFGAPVILVGLLVGDWGDKVSSDIVD